MLDLIDGRSTAGPVPIRRPTAPGGTGRIDDDARRIVDEVRAGGDRALRALTQRFDGTVPESLVVDPARIDEAGRAAAPELRQALEGLARRLEEAARAELGSDDSSAGGTMLRRPLRRVGVYVPGGRAAYPSSVLMAAVPARVAGVDEIAVCSPPSSGGGVAAAVLAACAVAGVSEVYAAGGAQAIAALAYGTETVRPVDKIVGPGNAYVTAAKRAVGGWVGTDVVAGPTEIVVVADASVPPDLVAVDLVAQAEHGPGGSHVLITPDEALLEAVDEALVLEVAAHPRADDVENALIEGGKGVLVRDLEHAMTTADAFAPEHLQLNVADPESLLGSVRNAGSVFLGRWSPVAVGDYGGATNHILPTGGAARWGSGLGVGDFSKRIYVTSLSRSALADLAPQIEALAATEGLTAHGRSVRMRLEGS